MLSPRALFVGIDTTSGHKAFTYAALDRDLNVLALADADMDEMLAFLGGQEAVTVAINSPSHLNAGLVRTSQKTRNDSAAPRSRSGQLRGVDLRLAEHELRQRGITVSGTASREALCSEWVRLGFDLYRRLHELGFEAYPAENCPRQVLETHPHAGFCALLGRLPLPKPSLEGRLQRELALFDGGLRMKDPMLFFEEITRHKLLAGVLPLELLYPPEQLDALIAAYTSWVAGNKQGELSRLGSADEGYIHLPVGHLKEKYQA